MLQRDPRHKPSPLQFSTTDFSASSSQGTFLSPSSVTSPLSSPSGRSIPSPRQQRFGSLSPRQMLNNLNPWQRQQSESRIRQQSESRLRQHSRDDSRFKTVYFTPIIRDSGIDLDSPTRDPRDRSGPPTPTSLAEAEAFSEDPYFHDELDYLVGELAGRFCIQETPATTEYSSDRLDSPTLGASISSGGRAPTTRNPFAKPHWSTLPSILPASALPSRPPAQPLPKLPPTNASRKGSNYFRSGALPRTNSSANHFKPPTAVSIKNDHQESTSDASILENRSFSTPGTNHLKTPTPVGHRRGTNASVLENPSYSTPSRNLFKPATPVSPKDSGRPRVSSIASIPENPNFSNPGRSHIRNKSSVNINGVDVRSSLAPQPLQPTVYKQPSLQPTVYKQPSPPPTVNRSTSPQYTAYQPYTPKPAVYRQPSPPRTSPTSPHLALPPLFKNIALTDPNVPGQPIRYFSPQYLAGANSLKLGSCTFLNLAYGADVECGMRIEPATPETPYQSVILQVVQRVLKPGSGKTAWLLCSETDVSDAFTADVRAELASKVARPSPRSEMRKVRRSKRYSTLPSRRQIRYSTSSSIYPDSPTEFFSSDSEYDSDSDGENAEKESDLWITLANSLSTSSLDLPSQSQIPKFSNSVPISLPSSSPPSPALTDLLSLLTEIRFLHRHFFVLQRQPRKPSTWGNMIMDDSPPKRPVTAGSAEIQIPYLSSSLQRSLSRRFSAIEPAAPGTSILQTFVSTAASQASSWLPTSPSAESFTARLLLPRVQGYADRQEEMGVRGIWVGEGKQRERQESSGWHANMEDRRRPAQGYWICFVVAAGVEEALSNSNFF